MSLFVKRSHKIAGFLIATFCSASVFAQNVSGGESSAPSNTLFILLGAVMILAMHAGFAFLEVGSVRKKNQVNGPHVKLTPFKG